MSKEQKNVSPLTMANEIKTIKENYGKNAIIIKDNLVFRCSTEVLERGPKSLLDLMLPKYGKMNIFIVAEDGVHQLVCVEENPYTNSNVAKYEMSKETFDIDVSKIDFDSTKVWNASKKAEKTEKTFYQTIPHIITCTVDFRQCMFAFLDFYPCIWYTNPP